MGTSWISRMGGNLEKGGGGMTPLTNYVNNRAADINSDIFFVILAINVDF